MNELARISMKISGTLVPNRVKYVYCFAHNNINIPYMVKGLQLWTFKTPPKGAVFTELQTDKDDADWELKVSNGVNYNNITDKKLCILNNKHAMSGISSCDDISSVYMSYNFEVETIPYDASLNSINTRTESEALVDWISENNIQHIAICAPPYHTLRAFMTSVSVCIERGLNIKIYTINGMVDDWNDITITHNGDTKTSFNNAIELELERIQKYTEKGDICDCGKIWNYIK